jgi:hypothetical protein
MALKASLKIQLFADEVVVAESDDENLWRRVLAAMQGAAELPESEDDDLREDVSDRGARGRGNKGVDGLAKELGVTKEQLSGACGPSAEAPYIHLDPKCWETFKKNTPARGAAAISATQLAGTFLCLWFHHGGIDGRPTQVQAREVFTALGASDKNPSRSIKNCAWLQSRGGGIQINPAEISKAHAVAKAFVLKQKIVKSD